MKIFKKLILFIIFINLISSSVFGSKDCSVTKEDVPEFFDDVNFSKNLTEKFIKDFDLDKNLYEENFNLQSEGEPIAISGFSVSGSPHRAVRLWFSYCSSENIVCPSSMNGEYFLYISWQGKNDGIYFPLRINKCEVTFTPVDTFIIDEKLDFTKETAEAIEKLKNWTEVSRSKKLDKFEKRVNEHYVYQYYKNPREYSKLRATYPERGWTGVSYINFPASSGSIEGITIADLLQLKMILRDKINSNFLKEILTSITSSDDDFK